MGVVKSVCPRDCYDTCFLEVVVENGVVKEVKPDSSNPITSGFLCPRGVADKLYVYRNRVLYPYVNVTGEKPGKLGRDFKRVSWGEALDLVAKKIKEVVENYGPEKVLHLEYAGNMGVLTWYFPQRLWNAIGASRTDYSICSKSGHEAISLHYGLSYGVLPEELSDMKLIVLWGFNAAVSAPHLWRRVLLARERGGLIVAVDPRKSETARSADLWISPRPGSDVWLVYGVMKVLVEKGLVDYEFIEKYTVGYSKLVEEVSKYSLGEIASITGVSEETVRNFAEIYGTIKPNAIMIGLGVQKSANGAEVSRALSLLPALVGQHRGFYYSNSRGFLVDIGYLTGEKMATKKIRVVSQTALAEHVYRGEFKVIYVWNMNPLLTLPGQVKLREGLVKHKVFLVTHTTHWNETCEFSDVVLPAPTYLEKDDLVIPYSHNYVRYSRRVIEPLGESRDEVWVMREIAVRLGLSEWWLYEDPLDALRVALRNALEASFEDLFAGRVVKLKYRPREEYQTPSGKVEFYSTLALERGFDPLPRPGATGEGSGEFVFLNTASPLYTHTQFREVYGEPRPLVHVNPVDAGELGVRDGDTVEVCNENDCLKFLVKVDDSLPRRTLWTVRQIKSLEGKPMNSLVPTSTQVIGGGPVFNSTRVTVRKIEGEHKSPRREP